MVCARCAHAADNHLPADQHCSQACGGPGRRCDCQHRVDDYRKEPAATKPNRCPLLGDHGPHWNELNRPGEWRCPGIPAHESSK